MVAKKSSLKSKLFRRTLFTGSAPRKVREVTITSQKRGSLPNSIVSLCSIRKDITNPQSIKATMMKRSISSLLLPTKDQNAGPLRPIVISSITIMV
jgi:hypothetical protein